VRNQAGSLSSPFAVGRAGFNCVEALGRIIIEVTVKCYNLHALTIVIITKYIYIYFYTL